MSRTPGRGDDEFEPPPPEAVGPDASSPFSPPIAIDVRGELSTGFDTAPAEDSELLARDERAALEAGDDRRADGLACARALLAQRQGGAEAELPLWRGVFDRDPTLLIAFWGLRRALHRRGAWTDLRGVIERRLDAIFGPERALARAELWLDHGRLCEDRLGRDEDAAQSYRAGLLEAPDHPGLLTSLLLWGFRRADQATTAEALAGILRHSLPSKSRAAVAASLSRLEWTASISAPVSVALTASQTQVGDHSILSNSLPVSLDPAVAARALQILRAALRAVEPRDAGPLIAELFALIGATAEPALRAEILGVLIQYHPPGDDAAPAGANGHAGLVAALLRERARLLRDHLNDPTAAAAALRAALVRVPGHPGVIADLSDVIETLSGDDAAQAGVALRDLLGLVAPADRPFQTDAESELGLRYLTALVRNGQWTDGLALFERHPELPRDRPDVFALEVLLRAATGDMSGLADAFERAGELISRGAGDGAAPDQEAAAHALVVAGTLRARGRGADGVGDADDVAPEATRLYRRAIDIAPGYAPALDAVERPLWTTAGRSAALRELLEHRLKQIRRAASAAADFMTPDPHAAASPKRPDDGAELASQVLEDLVAVCRDRLDDPTAARRYQDELMATTGGDVRAWARRHDLELAAAARGDPSRPEIRAGILCELAERAGEPELKSALLVEAARLAAGADNPVLADGLLRQALVSDQSGIAASGLERLAPGAAPPSAAAARAAIVRDECARLIAIGEPVREKTARLRALRFRVAWHELCAERAAEALEALGPLRAAGDHLAVAWSWEIARRLGDPQQRLSLLRSAPRGAESGLLERPGDLAEALEAAGDLPAAAIAFRDAQRREPATESALGLLRVASALGDGAAVLEATRLLAAGADAATASQLAQEVGFLELFEGTSPVTPGADRRLDDGHRDGDGPVAVVLRWAAGVRGSDALGAAAGLLAVARALPDAGTPESVNDRNGLLARAAARARLGGTALAGAVHDQVAALSAGAAPIGVGLSDLPVVGRPERIAARLARAERTGGHLAYALDLERGLDAEARGDGPAALDGFARAVVRDPEGIEALDGIKRVALATGDRVGAARAGVRLGAVLRVPARAAAEFAMAGQIWEDLGMPAEAGIAYWHAFARDSGSDWLYERLRHLLTTERDGEGLDRLYGHRLAAMPDPRARTELLLERARHRLDHLDNRKAAIEDFKRILKVDPDHRVALRQLATLAMKMEYFAQAVRFLDRLLARGGEEPEAAALRLELADAHEAAHEPARALEVLRRAAAARPLDVAPWQRLTDLLLRTGDWSGALATLHSWDAVLSDPIAKSGIWVRIGCLSRDHGRDVTAAATAFATAADLDPLGDGLRELVTLHRRSGAVAARRQALDRAIAQMRQTLVADPLDVARLRRLREMYEWSAADGGAATTATAAAPTAMPVDVAHGARLVGQLLALLGEDVERSSAPRPQLRGALSEDFWLRLRAPGSGRLAAEVWATIAPAVAALFPARNQPRPNQRERVAPGTEPRLAWVEAAAAAVGLPGLELWMPRKGAVEPGDESVVPLDGGTPGLWLGPGALTGNATVRFRVGRALALIRERAVVIDRLSASELTTLFSAAARIAGASAAVLASTALLDITDTARALGKAMARKDRKALEAQAPRFDLDSSNPAGFRESVLATADRLGLFIAGDVAAAARVTGDFDPASDVVPTSAAIASRPRAIQLIRFALSDDYLALRHAGEVGEL